MNNDVYHKLELYVQCNKINTYKKILTILTLNYSKYQESISIKDSPAIIDKTVFIHLIDEQ